MSEKEATVVNRAGMHTRPAAMVVQMAAKYKSEIYLIRDGFLINAKSIIGVMTLTAERGCRLIVRAEGPDEDNAVKSIAELIDSGFGEAI
ncbi:MAG: HPr family phosphocarrier protein [Candidatus Kapabacteria bacterium]|nr:HPr family phosphocarrier protein [Candidatus Kapabacteria bacterium]